MDPLRKQALNGFSCFLVPRNINILAGIAPVPSGAMFKIKLACVGVAMVRDFPS
jgi:hypothetical protein